MTNARKCLKCGQITQYTDTPPISCSNCGAVYAKVEQALMSTPQRAIAPSRQGTASRLPGTEEDHLSFAEEMRSSSLYPTFRALTKIAYLFMLVLAVVIAGVGIFAGTSLGFGYLLGGVLTAVFVFIVARVGREMSLMLADLSDATVRLAAQRNRDES